MTDRQNTEIDSNLASTQTCDLYKKIERQGYKKTKLGWMPEEWEVVKLGNVGEFKNGINKGKEDFGFGIPFINLMDVFGKPVLLKDQWGLVNATQSEIENYNLKKGDVLFIRSSVKPSGVGLTSVVKDDVPNTVYSGFLIRYRPNDDNTFDINFLQYCFHEMGFRQRLIVRSSSSANTNINQDNLKQLLIGLPPLPEQQKIATILSTWDRAIAKQEQLIAAKQEFKKGLMQLLLSGKLRFPEFSNLWQKTRLGQITRIKAGGTPSKRRPEYWGGDIKWMNSGELNLKKVLEVEGRINKLGLENSSTTMLPKYCILIGLAGQGKTRGTAAINMIELCTNQSVAAILPSTNHDPFFLFYLMDSKYNYLRRLSTGDGGRGGLNLAILNSIPVHLPEISEQRRISSMLINADDELEILENELLQIRGQKRGLMQRLLTGEVRVKIN